MCSYCNIGIDNFRLINSFLRGLDFFFNHFHFIYQILMTEGHQNDELLNFFKCIFWRNIRKSKWHNDNIKKYNISKPLTCLWINTTDPNSLQVPPCLSTCNIRRIWRNLIPRMADVANTCPLEPSVRTTIEATTTIKSVNKTRIAKSITSILVYNYWQILGRLTDGDESTQTMCTYKDLPDIICILCVARNHQSIWQVQSPFWWNSCTKCRMRC